MSLQQIAGDGMFLPTPILSASLNSFRGDLLIDATGEKAALMGRVWWRGRSGTKSIRKVGFRFGSITKAGGSALTVSLQDVDSANGPVMRPDGTQDQTVAIANGDASFASNTWYQTGALSADRSVAFGELLAVVIEYDGAGRLGSDSVALSSLFNVNAGSTSGQSVAALFTSSWGNTNTVPVVVLEFSDGTFGTLSGGYVMSAQSSVAYKQDTSGADEYALAFQVPFPCKVDGAWVSLAVNAGTGNFDVVLYDGTSAMTNGTVSIDANAFNGTGQQWPLIVTFPAEITLDANHTYYLAFKPTQTTTNITLYYFDVANANHLEATGGGTSFHEAKRLDLGSWTTTTTRRPFAGIRISSLDDGAGGGAPAHVGGIMRPHGFRQGLTE